MVYHPMDPLGTKHAPKVTVLEPYQLLDMLFERGIDGDPLPYERHMYTREMVLKWLREHLNGQRTPKGC